VAGGLGDLYVLESGEWRELWEGGSAGSPEARSGMGFAWARGRLYVFGGLGSVSGTEAARREGGRAKGGGAERQGGRGQGCWGICTRGTWRGRHGWRWRGQSAAGRQRPDTTWGAQRREGGCTFSEGWALQVRVGVRAGVAEMGNRR